MLTFGRALIFVVPISLVALACGNSDTKPAVTSDPGKVGTGTGGGSAPVDGADGGVAVGDAGECNTLVNQGSLIDRIGVVGDPPDSLGGTIEPGTYVLTDYAVYQGTSGTTVGPTGISVSSTILLAANQLDEIQHIVSTAAPQDLLSTVEISATGTTLVVVTACPSAGISSQLSYTEASPKIIFTNPITKEVKTYTKQ